MKVVWILLVCMAQCVRSQGHDNQEGIGREDEKSPGQSHGDIPGNNVEMEGYFGGDMDGYNGYMEGHGGAEDMAQILSTMGDNGIDMNEWSEEANGLLMMLMNILQRRNMREQESGGDVNVNVKVNNEDNLINNIDYGSVDYNYTMPSVAIKEITAPSIHTTPEPPTTTKYVPRFQYIYSFTRVPAKITNAQRLAPTQVPTTTTRPLAPVEYANAPRQTLPAQTQQQTQQQQYPPGAVLPSVRIVQPAVTAPLVNNTSSILYRIQKKK